MANSAAMFGQPADYLSLITGDKNKTFMANGFALELDRSLQLSILNYAI